MECCDDKGNLTFVEYWLNNRKITEKEHKKAVLMDRLSNQTAKSKPLSI